MTVKIILSAFAVTAALAIGAPAFADDTMGKPMDHPMHHHHHPMHHHAVMHHEHMEHHAMHHHHGAMGVDAKERLETKRLNEEQLHKGM